MAFLPNGTQHLCFRKAAKTPSYIVPNIRQRQANNTFPTISIPANLDLNLILNNASSLSKVQTYHIPDSDLALIIENSRRFLGTKDSLILLLESLYSSTERIHAGGHEAAGPVEVFGHKHGNVQMQIVGINHRLTPWMVAQVVTAISTVGAKGGFFQSSMLIAQSQDSVLAVGK
ncbi:MAG: hypothetical protein Q9223_007552, partial [Gallowayella weberi]